ncbi:conserved hypothetical protein, membrane [mine drainage metagenome]|uniref:Uncharacterized protein n=1 Tax=mine drainage metagenome TaxID=410659 RepID=T1APZ2_9ZZZZ
MILYSFLFFVVLGLVAAHKYKYTEYVVIASIGIIVISSLAYFSIPNGTYAAFAINLAIIGYYLLISAVISIFASIIAENNNLHIGKRVAKAFAGKQKQIYAFMIAIGILFLVLPLWPDGSFINYSVLPYAALHITSVNQPAHAYSNGTYLLIINLSNYSSVINPQGSNIRLVYQNGSAIKAAEYDAGGIRVGNYTEDILLESAIHNSSTIYLYFYPYNATYSRNFSPMPLKAFDAHSQNASVINVTLGSLSNVLYKTVNRTITAYAVKHGNSTSSYPITLLPYYDLQAICNMGNDTVASINFTSNNTVSFFMFNNISDFTASTVNITPSYRTYLKSFSQNSETSELNLTYGNKQFNLTNCLYYSFVTNSETRIAIHTTQNYIYYTPYSITKSFALPSIGDATQRHENFVWNSIIYTFFNSTRNAGST